ncbi:cell wall-binding protein [Gracilibacillus boraciitolerans JCM 21714]|uniref:Cell wall-binding protein n=1 Tax=Gracilibacillus boraciitolerans JCM 21714 TaxID=1298598 RepID=W4VQQ6_9BACI|nr:peptidoglycan-binding protein [Gracilibacillus boraciitolerans]GAE95283.1 cell wall-binding protein [Gracilibacillus boraciitolerans JCM 21714]
MFKSLRNLFMIIVVGVFIMISAPSLTEAAMGGDRVTANGSSGSDVVELQDYLMTKGVFPYYTATGYYGDITEEAVEDFQRKRNLKIDGIAGPQTYNTVQVLRKGDIGKQVIHIQYQLKETGHYNSSIDGIYGSGTVSAVKSFQKQKGLAVDGIAGPNTRSALDSLARRGSAAGETWTVESTAFTADCDGCLGMTRMGLDLKKYPDAKVIAVDPSVIPLGGSIVEVEGYGVAIAADIGGGINGKSIDVFIPNRDDALQWGGRKDVRVNIIE